MLPDFETIATFPGAMFQQHWNNLDDYGRVGIVVVSFNMFRIFDH